MEERERETKRQGGSRRGERDITFTVERALEKSKNKSKFEREREREREDERSSFHCKVISVS